MITRLNIGGPGRQALLLTRELSERFPTTLVAGTPTKSEGELFDPTVPVHRAPLVRPVRPHHDARAVLRVRRLLLETRASLLHTHTAKAGSVGRLAALTVNPRPRTVHTFHGHVLEGYFSGPVRRAFVEIERRLARHTDILVTVSTEVRDALLDLGIGRPDQYRVITLGFDLQPFLAVEEPAGKLRRSLGLATDVPLVGIVGRLVPIKDVATMLAAVSLVPDVHLAVVGDGELRAELEQRARRMGIAERVHFTGWVDDVPSAMSDLDVVALSSRNEGTPVSLIEAAAAGRPVVATRVGGVPLVVQAGVTGYLVRPGDAAEMAASLSRLLADPWQREQMGAAARRHAREQFSQERLLTEISALYTDLLSATTRR
ncbi:MAG: glycosyltransferase [Actinomycetota bacterium]|nr:glycosyltransferase [Actinomycetota bacterium]